MGGSTGLHMPLQYLVSRRDIFTEVAKVTIIPMNSVRRGSGGHLIAMDLESVLVSWEHFDLMCHFCANNKADYSIRQAMLSIHGLMAAI
jgi:hypothetical protein